MAKKVLLISAATAALGLGAFTLIANSKKIKMKRAMHRASVVMYTVGTVLRSLSGEAELV